MKGPVNWHRGLLRVWLLIAALWAAAVIAVNWGALTASLSEPLCVIGIGDGPWCAYRRLGFVVNGGIEDRAFWLVLVVPPVVLLAAGYAIRWVKRGF